MDEEDGASLFTDNDIELLRGHIVSNTFRLNSKWLSYFSLFFFQNIHKILFIDVCIFEEVPLEVMRTQMIFLVHDVFYSSFGVLIIDKDASTIYDG